jgi:D-alanine-D-alanine ligase
VIGNREPQASPVGEIIPAREFYDYVAKYEDNSTQLKIPAELPKGVEERIRELAVAAFKAIDCAGMARVDFFLAENGEIFINEVNTIPGFTPISMYPKLWEIAGLSYSALITKLIDLALERWRDRRYA